jgi:hypothetical protein
LSLKTGVTLDELADKGAFFRVNPSFSGTPSTDTSLYSLYGVKLEDSCYSHFKLLAESFASITSISYKIGDQASLSDLTEEFVGS